MKYTFRPRHIEGPTRIFLGVKKSTSELIFIYKPQFDCNWYWAFGYLGNNNCHYHLKSYQNKDLIIRTEDGKLRSFTEHRNINMYDALQSDYDLSDGIKSNLWQFCELAKTIYTLKNASETFHRGGAHYTENVGKEYLKDRELYRKITFDILPLQMQAFWSLITPTTETEGE